MLNVLKLPEEKGVNRGVNIFRIFTGMQRKSLKWCGDFVNSVSAQGYERGWSSYTAEKSRDEFRVHGEYTGRSMDCLSPSLTGKSKSVGGRNIRSARRISRLISREFRAEYSSFPISCGPRAIHLIAGWILTAPRFEFNFFSSFYIASRQFSIPPRGIPAFIKSTRLAHWNKYHPLVHEAIFAFKTDT